MISTLNGVLKSVLHFHTYMSLSRCFYTHFYCNYGCFATKDIYYCVDALLTRCQKLTQVQIRSKGQRFIYKQKTPQARDKEKTITNTYSLTEPAG